jgi:hypothetical protein
MQAMYSRPTKAERLEAQISSTSGVSAMSDELKPWTPEHVKSLLDEWGILTDLPIAVNTSASLTSTTPTSTLRLKTFGNSPLKHRQYATFRTNTNASFIKQSKQLRSRAAVKERGEDTKLREKWERELLRSANVSGRSAYSYIEEFLQDLSQQ